MNKREVNIRYGSSSTSIALMESERRAIEGLISNKQRWSRRTPGGQVVCELPINELSRISGTNLYSFTPGPYVGSLNIGDTEINFLPPKWLDGLSSSHIIYMLISSEAVSPKSVYINELKGIQTLGYDGLSEPVYSLFTEACLSALHKGVYKSYQKNEVVLPTVKGKIVFDKQIKLNYSGIPRIVSLQENLLPDNTLGTLLYSAAKIVEASTVNPTTKNLALHVQKIIKFYYPNIMLFSQRDYKKLLNYKLHRRGAHLEWPLKLGKIIISGRKISTSGMLEDTLCLLVNLFDLFEGYIVSALKKIDNNYCHAYKVALYSEQNAPRARRFVYPDVIYFSGLKEEAVVDVKLKNLRSAGPDIDDIRQVYLYASLLNLNTAFLVYPFNKSEAQLSRYFICSSENRQVQIICYQIPVTSQFDEIEKNVKVLSDCIFQEFGIQNFNNA